MDHPSSLAQLVERTTVNRDVSGSIPLGRANARSQEVKAPVILTGTAGSNPVVCHNICSSMEEHRYFTHRGHLFDSSHMSRSHTAINPNPKKSWRSLVQIQSPHCGRSSVDRAPAPGHPTRKERELFIDASMWKKLTRPVNQHMYSKWSKEPVIEDRCRKTSQVRTLSCVIFIVV